MFRIIGWYILCKLYVSSEWIQLFIDGNAYGLQAGIKFLLSIVHMARNGCSFICFYANCTSVFIIKSNKSLHHFEAIKRNSCTYERKSISVLAQTNCLSPISLSYSVTQSYLSTQQRIGTIICCIVFLQNCLYQCLVQQKHILVEYYLRHQMQRMDLNNIQNQIRQQIF